MQTKDLTLILIALVFGIFIGVVCNDKYHYQKQSKIELDQLSYLIEQNNINKKKRDELILEIKVQELYRKIIIEKQLCN